MSDKKVYLSGRLQGCTEIEANGWRRLASKYLGDKHVIIPDQKCNYQGMTDAECVDLVNSDLSSIDSSVAVLLNAWSPGWGSGCELMYAHENAIPVIIVAENDISPWLRAHASYITPKLQDACKWIATRFELDSPILKNFLLELSFPTSIFGIFKEII